MGDDDDDDDDDADSENSVVEDYNNGNVVLIVFYGWVCFIGAAAVTADDGDDLLDNYLDGNARPSSSGKHLHSLSQ